MRGQWSEQWEKKVMDKNRQTEAKIDCKKIGRMRMKRDMYVEERRLVLQLFIWQITGGIWKSIKNQINFVTYTIMIYGNVEREGGLWSCLSWVTCSSVYWSVAVFFTAKVAIIAFINHTFNYPLRRPSSASSALTSSICSIKLTTFRSRSGNKGASAYGHLSGTVGFFLYIARTVQPGLFKLSSYSEWINMKTNGQRVILSKFKFH